MTILFKDQNPIFDDCSAFYLSVFILYYMIRPFFQPRQLLNSKSAHSCFCLINTTILCNADEVGVIIHLILVQHR